MSFVACLLIILIKFVLFYCLYWELALYKQLQGLLQKKVILRAPDYQQKLF